MSHYRVQNDGLKSGRLGLQSGIKDFDEEGVSPPLTKAEHDDLITVPGYRSFSTPTEGEDDFGIKISHGGMDTTFVTWRDAANYTAGLADLEEEHTEKPSVKEGDLNQSIPEGVTADGQLPPGSGQIEEPEVNIEAVKPESPAIESLHESIAKLNQSDEDDKPRRGRPKAN
jgi:hypothetical protein